MVLGTERGSPARTAISRALLSGNLRKQNALIIHTATVDIILDEQKESDSASVLQRGCRDRKVWRSSYETKRFKSFTTKEKTEAEELLKV